MIGKVMKNFCLITFEIWGELCGIYTTLNTVTNTFLLSLSQCFLQVSNKSVTALSSGNQGKGKTAIFKRWCMSILLYSVFTHEGTETHMNHWLERVELLHSSTQNPLKTTLTSFAAWALTVFRCPYEWKWYMESTCISRETNLNSRTHEDISTTSSLAPVPVTLHPSYLESFYSKSQSSPSLRLHSI